LNARFFGYFAAQSLSPLGHVREHSPNTTIRCGLNNGRLSAPNPAQSSPAQPKRRVAFSHGLSSAVAGVPDGPANPIDKTRQPSHGLAHNAGLSVKGILQERPAASAKPKSFSVRCA
tara:strand:- start:1021 stop:1371 length:351 start_codon:yes stop_codon:yes gene_type:complete